MKQAHVFISGFVQGVGYRQFVKKRAIDYHLSGWVRNLPDGRVEAVFQGHEKYIKEMINACEKGPMLSEVENVEVEWEEGESPFNEFTVRPMPS